MQVSQKSQFPPWIQAKENAPELFPELFVLLES